MRILVLGLGFFALACPSAPSTVEVSVSELRARATPPGARNGAVFMTLENRGPVTALIGVSSPAAETVELHTHVHEGEVMRMRRVESVPLPPGPTRFAPGGLHVMLIGLRAPLAAGDPLALTLRFAGGHRDELQVPIVAVEPSSAPASRPGSPPASQPGSLPSSRPGSLPASQPGSLPASKPTRP